MTVSQLPAPYSPRIRLIALKLRAMPDPGRLLRGTGSQTRYLEFGSPNDLDGATVEFYVLAALERRVPVRVPRGR